MISNPTARKGSPKFPRAAYRLRITGQPELCESKKPSAQGSGKYLRFNLECIGYYDSTNQQILSELNGEEIAGWEFSFVAAFLKDGRNIGLSQLHAAILDKELPPVDETMQLDEKTMIPVGVDYTDTELYAICESQESEKIDDVTGKPVINPLTAKPVVSYYRQIVNILTP